MCEELPAEAVPPRAVGRGVPCSRAVCTLGCGAMEGMGSSSSGPLVALCGSLCPPLMLTGLINAGLLNKASSWGIPFVSSRGEQLCSAFCWVLRSVTSSRSCRGQTWLCCLSRSLNSCQSPNPAAALGIEVGLRLERQLSPSQVGWPRR